ncbi:MAG: hypothetical protein Q4B32_05985 [Clostridia bacterium]|nr:hypothetical protein [Clostridia bacterium]
MKKNSLMPAARYLCAVVGVLWLAALLMKIPFHQAVIGRWCFLAGAAAAVVLLVLLFLQHRKEKQK